MAQEDLKIYFLGKVHFVLGFLAKDTAIYLYYQNTSLTQAVNSLSRRLSLPKSASILSGWQLVTLKVNQDRMRGCRYGKRADLLLLLLLLLLPFRHI